MGLRKRYMLSFTAGVLAFTLAVGCKMQLPDTFQRAELALFDAYQRAAPWRPADPRTRIVDIDEASLQRIGQWPWPRSVLAEMTRGLRDLGAAAIAYDVVFAEPDRTSPARLAGQWRQTYGAEIALEGGGLPDFDVDFAAALGRGRTVLGFALLEEPQGKAPREASVAAIGGDPLTGMLCYRGAVAPISILQDAAAGFGAVTMAASRDEIVRSLPLVFDAAGGLASSLALEALKVGADEDTLKIRVEHDANSNAKTGMTIRVGDLDIPVENDGSLRVHFGDRDPRTIISAWRLLDASERAKLGPELKDRIALIGTSAVGLADLRATPLNPLEPGVNVHAQAIEQALAGHFLSRPAWAAGAETAAAAALSLVLAALALSAPPLLALASGVALLCGVFVGGFLAFSRGGLVLDTSFTMLAASMTLLATLLARYFASERDALKLRSAFALYLAPALVEALARDPSKLKLGGELKQLSFVFTDLEGFTKLTETADPKDLVRWLNAYLDGLCQIAMAHGGAIDKIVGDALHVIFNAPLDQPDHALRAVRCALALDVFGKAYSEELRVKGIEFGVTRIGVNTGPAVVGNFGGGNRFDYTAHGDAINTAARLEAANKQLGTRICVAASTAEQVRDIALRPLGTLLLRGKSVPVAVFEPLAPGDPAPAA
jgi:adenylate cyclase